MKRGQSGLSCLLAIDKPLGASSHDVVNMARRILGEKRIGHSGTLDPFASGVLLLMVGPAARLDNYLTTTYKTYIATIVFGATTTTDDCTGNLLLSSSISPYLLDESYAKDILASFIGTSMQLPPVYSAIKIDGKKSYEEARKGNIVNLKPRQIEVKEANLLEIGQVDELFLKETRNVAISSVKSDVIDDELFEHYIDAPFWKVEFVVSKGTYLRSLARDIGIKVDCGAHLSSLRRTCNGKVSVNDCVSTESLSSNWKRACVDPLFALGYRVAFIDDRQMNDVSCGRSLSLFEDQLLSIIHDRSTCECLPPFVQTGHKMRDGELISVVFENELKAIYKYDKASRKLLPACVFNIGVIREFVD